jgi:hypothetical protein
LGRQKCIPAVIIQVEIPGITGDFVDASLNGQHHPFKIELRWLHPEGFADIFKKNWSRPVADQTPIQER